MRRVFASLLAILVLSFSTAPVATVYADVFTDVCSGDAGSSDVCQGSKNAGTNPLVGSDGLLRKISLILATGAGLAAVIVIIVSGFNYITSGGDPSKVNSAKNSLIYAVVGLIVIALSESIISIVLSRI